MEPPEYPQIHQNDQNIHETSLKEILLNTSLSAIENDQNTPKNYPKKPNDHQDDQNTLKNSKMTKIEGICPSKNIVKKLDWLEAYQQLN